MVDSSRVDQLFFRVPSDLRYGEALRAMLDTLCRRLEDETKTRDLGNHVISAFGEAFNNAVWHAYRGCRTGDIEIDIQVTATSLKLSMADYGKGFDMKDVKCPDFTNLPEGGLGLWIIRSYMTSVKYHRGKKNILVMEKHFAQPLALSDELQEKI